MEEKKRSRRDFIQNITITLLSLLAVVLFVRTQVYGRDLFALRTTTSAAGTVAAVESSGLSAPVRVAVSGSYGRYGSITPTTAADGFSPLGSLLGEVLSTSRTYTECTKDALLNALQSPSVYYDFLQSLPLSVLAGFVGGSGEDTISARHLVLSAPEGNDVTLYLWDHGERFLRCTTALSSAALEAVIGQYELGSADFAFDTTERYGDFNVEPLSLFVTEQPLPVLDSGDGTAASSKILSALGYNPHTQTRWTETSGTEVIVDGDRTLRIRSDGSLHYQSGGSAALQITAAGETPTLWEAASDVGTLLNKLLPEGSEGKLYLRSIKRSGTAITMTFDYQHSGIPILFSDGTAAAEVTLNGTSIADLSLTGRRYTACDETALLLPLHQAMAVAAQEAPGKELFIGYADYAAEQTIPQWLSD